MEHSMKKHRNRQETHNTATNYRVDQPDSELKAYQPEQELVPEKRERSRADRMEPCTLCGKPSYCYSRKRLISYFKCKGYNGVPGCGWTFTKLNKHIKD